MKLLWKSAVPGLPVEQAQSFSLDAARQRACLNGEVWQVAPPAQLLDTGMKDGVLSEDGREVLCWSPYPVPHVALYVVDEPTVPRPTERVGVPAAQVVRSHADAPYLEIDAPRAGTVLDAEFCFSVRGRAGGADLARVQGTAGRAGEPPVTQQGYATPGRSMTFTLFMDVPEERPPGGRYEVVIELTDEAGHQATYRSHVHLRPWTTWRVARDERFQEIFRHRRWFRRFDGFARCHLGSRVAAARGPQVLVLDAATGETVRELSGHVGDVTYLGHDPTTHCLVSAGYSWIVAWDTRTWVETARVACPKRHRQPYTIDHGPEGAHLAALYDNVAFKLPDLIGGPLTRRVLGHTAARTVTFVREEPQPYRSTFHVHVDGPDGAHRLEVPVAFDSAAWQYTQLAGETLLVPGYDRVACLPLQGPTGPLFRPKWMEWRGDTVVFVHGDQVVIHSLGGSEQPVRWRFPDHSLWRASVTADGRWVVAYDNCARLIVLDCRTGEQQQVTFEGRVEILGADPRENLVWLSHDRLFVRFDPSDHTFHPMPPPLDPFGPVYAAGVFIEGDGVQVGRQVYRASGEVQRCSKRSYSVKNVEPFPTGHEPYAFDALDPSNRVATRAPDGELCLWDLRG